MCVYGGDICKISNRVGSFYLSRDSESRFVSGLLYFNTPPGGGTTSFPIGFNEDGSRHVKVKAIKGNLLFFYDLLEDGNVDE